MLRLCFSSGLSWRHWSVPAPVPPSGLLVASSSRCTGRRTNPYDAPVAALSSTSSQGHDPGPLVTGGPCHPPALETLCHPCGVVGNTVVSTKSCLLYANEGCDALQSPRHLSCLKQDPRTAASNESPGRARVGGSRHESAGHARAQRHGLFWLLNSALISVRLLDEHRAETAGQVATPERAHPGARERPRPHTPGPEEPRRLARRPAVPQGRGTADDSSVRCGEDG